MRDMYAILGIPRSATCADVRAAYRRQALRTHPDKGGIAEEFMLVTEAFEVLGDSSRRAKYDLSHPVFGPADNISTNVPARCREGKTVGRPTSGAGPSEVDSSSKRKVRFVRDPSTGVGGRTSKPRADPAAESMNASMGNPGVAACHEASAPECATDASDRQSGRHVEATGCAEGKHPPEDTDSVSALVKQLLGLKMRALEHKLRELPEDTLRQLAQVFQQRTSEPEEAEQSCIVVHAGAAGDGVPWNGCAPADGPVGLPEASEATPMLQLCDAQPHGVETPFQEKFATNGASSTKALRKRGGFKSFGKFVASVGIECMQLISTHVATLDAAIDFHIRLVQLRQVIRAAMDEGQSFPHALRASVAHAQAEWVQESLPRMKLTYIVQTNGKNYQVRTKKRTKDLGEATRLWQSLVAEESRRKAAIREARTMNGRLLEAARQQRFEARQKRLEEKRLWLEQRERRAEARRQRILERQQRQWMRKQHAQRRNMRRQSQLREKNLEQLRNILARVLVALRRLDRNRQDVLRKRWGIREFPPGLEFATLGGDDCVRALITLANGTTARGPLRQALWQANKDLNDLTALQRVGGDAVACAELERRDVEAMTRFFMDRSS